MTCSKHDMQSRFPEQLSQTIYIKVAKEIITRKHTFCNLRLQRLGNGCQRVGVKEAQRPLSLQSFDDQERTRLEDEPQARNQSQCFELPSVDSVGWVTARAFYL